MRKFSGLRYFGLKSESSPTLSAAGALNAGEALTQQLHGRSITVEEGRNVLENVKGMNSKEKRFLQKVIEP